MTASVTTTSKSAWMRCSPRKADTHHRRGHMMPSRCFKAFPGESPMSEQTLPKAKKSVALSGVAAGNTALCTVGRSGNDLHYRGYDIHDLAAKGCFEEV